MSGTWTWPSPPESVFPVWSQSRVQWQCPFCHSLLWLSLIERSELTGTQGLSENLEEMCRCGGISSMSLQPSKLPLSRSPALVAAACLAMCPYTLTRWVRRWRYIFGDRKLWECPSHLHANCSSDLSLIILVIIKTWYCKYGCALAHEKWIACTTTKFKTSPKIQGGIVISAIKLCEKINHLLFTEIPLCRYLFFMFRFII